MSKNGSQINVIRESVDESKIDTLDVTHAEHIGGYKIHIWFSDSKNQIVDFEPFLKSARNPSAAKYLDLQKFKRFQLDYGNLHWNDYEMCFSIEDLYNNDIGVEIENEAREKVEKVVRELGLKVG